jgi:hypothetical protein
VGRKGHTATISRCHLLRAKISLCSASGPLYGVAKLRRCNTRRAGQLFLEENVLAKIPQVLHEHINTAYPANVCLVGTVLPNGFAQITPRGSTMVFDDEHIALWERGRGTTTENLTDGTPVTIFMRKPALREAGILPKGGILRLYGRAKIHKSGAVYEEVWNRLIEAEKKSDPEKRGYAVLVTIERAEDLSGQPLT